MSLPIYWDFSGPVMYVPTVGNPMTTKGVIGATTNAIAGPVAKKSAPISWRLTQEATKPPDVVPRVIGTFLETRVSKHISLLTIPANPSPTPSPPSAFFAVAVQHVVNRTSD